MPLTYSIDAARRRVETVAVGPVTHAEVQSLLDWELANGVLKLPEFVEATRGSAAFTPDEVRSLVARLRTLHGGTPIGPAAVLVADDLSFGMIRMLGLLIGDVCDICPFRDRVQAEAWLDSVSGPLPPAGGGN